MCTVGLLIELVSKTVDDVRNYEWIDGELVEGMTIGWNFGDGTTPPLA